MLKIRALNRETSSDEDVPVIRREAQEEIALELYNKALRCLAEKQFNESNSILQKLINENIPLLENNGGLPKSMSNFKYSCHRNLGSIHLNLKQLNEGLEQFLLASELDSTDVTLWYKIGNLSLKQDKFRQAANAFAKGLECSEAHWPCLDKLITVLFATRDTVSCLEYIGKALMLDPDYTKGLVLRKQIYKDNPGTREYYKLYNPDYIWEPPLDVPIEEEDEKTYLKEAKELYDHVNEIEKSYGPKPLQTIPLPKPLKEYTWLALADTIIYLHQYLTENGLSHFTFIDMDRCMSNDSDSQIFKLPQIEVENVPRADEEKGEEKLDGQRTPEVMAENEENMDIGVPPERRPSQNSETNNEGQDHTPVQTDNDEEQNMDQDTEQEDNTTESKERGKTRGSKRKRDLLSDLRTWGWYSRRKLSKKAKDKDFTVEDALERVVPKHLLPHRIDPEKFNNFEDSMNTMDLYNLYMENDTANCLSPIHSPKSVNYEPYFGTDRENEEVRLLWTRSRPYCDAIVLVKDLVFGLSKIWMHKWPKELIGRYVEAFGMFREHCDQPQVFCSEAPFEVIRDDALATLLYGELLSFSCDGKDIIHPTSLGYLLLVSGWHDQWQAESSMFFNRVYWLRSHLFRKENSNELAARALELIQEVIGEEEEAQRERYLLSLPNCLKYGLISREIAERILRHLDLLNALASVEALFAAEKYQEVADIIKMTFKSGGTHHQVGRMGRPAQLGLLMHSLWFTDLPQCFIWTEECLHESFEQYLRFSKDHEKWESVVEKCLAILHEIVKKETVGVIDLLEEGKRARLVETLAKIVSKQLNSEGMPNIPLSCVTPWILLHYILQREEHRQYANKRMSQSKRDKIDDNQAEPQDENVLPASISILFSAHEFLGAKSWCMTGQGELLHFILDTVLDRIDTPIFDRLRNKIYTHIEQAMFCLYQHPSKKNKVSRHLADHNVDPLPLTWERSFQLFEFYGPDRLPEFNSYKNASVSADLEQLLKRIIALVPQTCAPQQHLQKVMDYIHGKTDVFPEPIEFPDKVRSIYYLIGDFYFKQREFSKCIKYFQMDLCINPLRLDSWACLGLSYAAQLDAKLNHCERFKSEMEFLDKAKYASICFAKALEICPDPLMLWIECGTFQYTVHSYCSRVLKFESENLSMEKFEFLENQKNTYLDSSGNSFEKAIAIYEMEEDTNDADERWLQYYILGKIAEKKQKEPTEYLQYYMTASTLLDENKAEYPEKINYNNPQHLAVEALELHYRINASVLKYLELHEGKDIPSSVGTFFKKCLNSSKFLKKPSPPEPKPEEDVKVGESNSTSFQEQFLNSLSKSVEENNEVIEKKVDENFNDKTVEQVEVAVHLKIDSASKENQPGENDLAAGSMKSENIIELDDNDVIMISDSDDDREKAEEKLANEKTENKEAVGSVGSLIRVEPDENIVTITKQDVIGREVDEDATIMVNDLGNSIQGDETMIPTNSGQGKEADSFKNSIHNEDIEAKGVGATGNAEILPVKDVQTMLDKMMEQTMKDTVMEVDSDVSGTEKIEEVVLSKDEKNSSEPEKQAIVEEETEKVKTGILEEVDKLKKSKSSNMETDNVRTSVEEDSTSSSSCSSSSSSSSDSSDDEDDETSSNSSSSDATNEFLSQTEISQMIDKCVGGLEICITRLAQNYKALYRLAHLYFNYKSKKDMIKCKQLLMSEYKCKDGTVVAGLFNDRKPTNFFNGIWRIPSTEIDRPGSLSAHMSRCISLLLQILRTTNDNKTLTDLSLQLKKIPEPDKIYIKDSERLAFSEQALTMCSQSLRGQMKNMSSLTHQQIIKLLQDIFKLYQRLHKQTASKDNQFASMLVEVYKKFIKEKIPDNVNVLDLATRFCLQSKQAEKQKLLPQKPAVLSPRGAGSFNNLAAPTPVYPLAGSHTPRRPSASRPRGRPPLPKTYGHPRNRSAAPSGVLKTPSPSAASYPSWQNPLFDYLKHYQDELIKQYSQNLSMAQLGQLSQMLAQGQINNPLTASAITNQFLAQSGLLTPTALVNQMGAVGAMGQNTATQFVESLNQLSPSMKKKLGVDQLLPNLGAGGISTNNIPTIPTKMVSPHTVTTPSGIIQSKPKSSSSLSKPSSSVLKQSSSVPTKAVVAESLKGKSVKKSIPTSTSLFKEPTTMVKADDKTAKDLMKDRPNISITPVAVTLPPPPSISPSFMRPALTTSPSGGKTLQEKLADKKKEQMNKLKAENALKTLSIPSSVRLTAAPAPKTSLATPPKFPADMGMGAAHLQSKVTNLPPSISVSKSTVSLPTPKFSPESGVSISQVRINQPKEKSNSSVAKETSKSIHGVSLGPEVAISKIKREIGFPKKSEKSSNTVGVDQKKTNSDHSKDNKNKAKLISSVFKDKRKDKVNLVEYKKNTASEDQSSDDVICID